MQQMLVCDHVGVENGGENHFVTAHLRIYEEYTNHPDGQVAMESAVKKLSEAKRFKNAILEYQDDDHIIVKIPAENAEEAMIQKNRIRGDIQAAVDNVMITQRPTKRGRE